VVALAHDAARVALPETGEARFTAIRHCQRVRLPYTSVGGQSTKVLFSGEYEYVGSFTLGGRGCAAVIFQDFFEDQPLQLTRREPTGSVRLESLT